MHYKKIITAVMIFCCLLLSCSCGRNLSGGETQSEGISPESFDIGGEKEDPRMTARQFMKDWQIANVLDLNGSTELGEAGMLPISVEQAEIYIAQKDMLKESDCDMEQWGVDIASYLAPDDKMLDRLHAYIGEWMLMRENMAVLFSKPVDDIYYSIVYLTGYDTAPKGICLVQYTEAAGEIEILSADMANQDLTMYGTYFGIRPGNQPVCFGIVKNTQMLPDASGRKPSSITSLQYTMKNGSVFNMDVPDKPYFFIEILPSDSEITKIAFFNEEGEVEESISGDEISYFICPS